MRNRFTIKIIILLLFGATIQAQTGGTFTVTQSVIAGGGGQNSTGGNFALDGAIGQAITGTGASGAFNVKSGFFTASAPLGTTAAAVSLSGRVRTAGGRGIMNVIVTLTGSDGVTRQTRTGSFGYFRFDDVTSGQTCLITVTAKRFTFENPTQIINIADSLAEINFTAFDYSVK